MLYNKNQLIRRLQETDKELLTENELFALATPYINSIVQVIASVKNAIDNGYSGEYSINYVSRITAISRQTLYRWENDGIFQRLDNKLNMSDLYNSLRLIERRQTNPWLPDIYM